MSTARTFAESFAPLREIKFHVEAHARKAMGRAGALVSNAEREEVDEDVLTSNPQPDIRIPQSQEGAFEPDRHVRL